MESKQINRALKFDWEPWLKRDFFAFMISTFQDGGSKRAFKKIGLPGWEVVSFMFDNGEWYWSEGVYDLVKGQIQDWLKAHRISEITERLDKFYLSKRSRILKLAEKPEENTQKKLKEISDILVENTAYIWSAHFLEHYLFPKIKGLSQKYIDHDIDKFIGDASYPEKKNKLEQMDDEIRKGADPKSLVRKYGWMRARDGFARGYNLKEIIEHSKTVKKNHVHVYPYIPPALKKSFEEARELVYLRTQRTDVYYELIFLARPIFKAIAAKYGIDFNDLKYYTIHSLIDGRPLRYPKNFGSVSYKNKLFFFEKPLRPNLNHNKHVTEVKGVIAQPGNIKGIAKVVMKVSELNKVKRGDILVTYMTSPNFLPAMKLSSAFVTNEGGLTCHAAIIAREIKKPCVIGTRIATEIFKDGDLIEVDANIGLVKLIKRG